MVEIAYKLSSMSREFDVKKSESPLSRLNFDHLKLLKK